MYNQYHSLLNIMFTQTSFSSLYFLFLLKQSLYFFAIIFTGSSPDEIQLILASGVKIFSANAATCYVLEANGNETDVGALQLMEWESTKLKVIIHYHFANVIISLI